MSHHFLKKFFGSQIAIVGFGREGKSLAYFLYRRLGYKSIIICDKNSNINAKQYPRYQFRLGENYLKGVEKFDSFGKLRTSIIYL